MLVATAVVAAACALVSGCDRQPLDIRPGGGGGGGTTGIGASGGSPSIGGTTGMACGSVEQVGRRLPADILILLDASGSMDQDASNTVCSGGCGAGSKWALAASAINRIVSETEQSTNFGLKLFADGGSTNSCTVGSGATVPVAAGNAGAIAAAIAARTSANGGVSNGSRTPTRAAETMATQYLAGLTTDHPKFILLVTDGQPNCMPGGVDQAADDSAGSIAAVADARALGIPTMVIGIATAGEPADATLTAMAIAGGYARATSPAYYPVASADELYSTTLRTLIRVSPDDCVFSLPPSPTGSPRPNIGVRVNGKDVPFDASHTNGWDYTDGTRTSVEVYGPACDDYLAAETRTATILFYCLDTG
jgi:von Willebrand factor type A domain